MSDSLALLLDHLGFEVICHADAEEFFRSEPPTGRNRWTLRLLASRMVELEYTERVSYETVRVTLKKTHSSRG